MSGILLSIVTCVLALGVAAFILWLLFKIFKFSIKVLWKLLINALVGVVLLLITNLIGGIFGIVIPITFITALVAGVFGILGIILLIIIF